jgi:hypothetical protein
MLLGLMLATGSADAAIYRFSWSGSVSAVEGDAPGTDVVVGDPISVRFAFDTAAAAETFSGNGPGGGTFRQYNAPLTDYRFSIGSYLVQEPAIVATLSYTDDQFDQDFINFLTQRSEAGPFGSIVANGQLIAQGPGSILPSPHISAGFPYTTFPVHRLFLGFTNGVTSKRVFGDLAVTVMTVPEPATWAVMVTGLFGVGAAMRSQRRAAIRSA